MCGVIGGLELTGAHVDVRGTLGGGELAAC